MNISTFQKADVFRVLYNNARVQGMGILQAKKGDMSIEEAQEIIDSGQTYFDYVYGRVMKVNLKNDELNTALYNRDNGPGASERAIGTLIL